MNDNMVFEKRDENQNRKKKLMPVARFMIGEPKSFHSTRAYYYKKCKGDKRKKLIDRMKVKFEEVEEEEAEKFPAKILALKDTKMPSEV